VSTANYFLPPLIAAYTERYPGVRISLQVANRETVLAALADHRTDIAITGEPPEGVDLEAQQFMDNPLVMIAHPSHRLAGLSQVSLARLREERLVVREPGSGTRAATERHFTEHKVDYLFGCELSSNEAIKQAVQAGLGLGWYLCKPSSSSSKQSDSPCCPSRAFRLYVTGSSCIDARNDCRPPARLFGICCFLRSRRRRSPSRPP